MMRRRVVLAALLLLPGCSSILPKPKYIARVNWPLQPPPPSQNPADPAGPVLLLRGLTAAPGLDQQGVQSLNADGSLNVDYYNLWAVDPAEAATQDLLDWLQASGAFSAVVSPGTRLTPSLIVEGELTELVADPAHGTASAVLTLVVLKSGAGIAASALPLTQTRITGTAPLSGTTPAEEVAAQTAALASALGQAVGIVTKYAG